MSPPLQAPDYKYVTEDCLREWKGQAAAAFRVPDPVPMPRFLYELCWAVLRGDLPPQKCRAALDSVAFVEEAWQEESGSVLADIVAHLGQDITISGEYRSRLVKMTKSFVESSLVVPRLLQERCEEEFLWEVEQSKSKGQDLKAKEVRVNTRLLYQQTKFNLLREESEGYAKLITLLCQVGSDLACQAASSATISIVKSLIGHFDLDPNRVFDIVLECFELYSDNDIFYQLIPLFPKSHAAQILGFKFQYYQQLDVNSPVPSGLFRIAALLIKSGLIDLDNLYVHLLPNDDEAFEHFGSFVSRKIDEATKIGKINLAATGKDLMDDEKQEITIDLHTALEMENDIIEERAPEIEKNQKLGLLLGFLSVHDWDHAQLLFERLAQLNPVEHVEICDGLLRIIEKIISAAYSTYCQAHYKITRNIDTHMMDASSVSSPSYLVDLPKEFFQMLVACGPYLHRDTQLFQKVCRVLKVYHASSKESARTAGAMSPESRIEEALGSSLLPSLQLIPANPAVDMEIWGVLSLLPYEVRYRLYGEWEKDTEQNPIVLAARQTAKLDTRRLLKRLAKENLKQLGRMVAKLAHANPMTVLRTIVQQVEAYRDMINPVVDAFKYLTQLEYDILQYIVIERLAQGGREKVKDDGLNLSDWLQCLASFWGHLCKKHLSMELKCLFQYIVNQLKKGLGTELVVLEELIQQMANVQYTENMTDEQVDAMAGSETLRLQSSLFGSTRNYKVLNKSTNKLRDSLHPKDEPKLAIPLLLLIAQHRSKIIINADATYIKMVSEQFDRCHGILLQYAEFLSSALTPATYVQLIPPLEDLVYKYHIEPEVAFLIYRPVMRLFKSANGGEACWPLDGNEEGESVSSDDMILHVDSSQKLIMWSDLLNTIRTILPPKAWNSLSPELYATFWGLTLYDLHFPKDRYDAEIKKLHENLKQLEDNSDNSSIAISRRKKDKERIQDLLDKLNNESDKHKQHVVSVLQRLAREKDKWLSSSPDALKINMEFLQRCIYPRCVFSMQDAVYCATFVQTMHSLGTPLFNTVNHIDVFICKTLQPMICCCTEYEDGRLGRFLHETLKTAYYWKSDESIYERECGTKPGFAVYFRFPDNQRVSYAQFVKVHWKWSGRITKVLNQCMESKEYMEIRNALIVLTKITSIFPVLRKSGINIEKRVAKLRGDEREDLKVLATGVAAALAARKGTTRPTHYHILHDEIHFTADDVQDLVHSFSYVYHRSTTAISVVSPICYVHTSDAGSSSISNAPSSKAHITKEKALTIQVEFSNMYFEVPVDKNNTVSSAICIALRGKGITETDCYYSCNLEPYSGTEIIKSTGIKVGSIVHVCPRTRGGSKDKKRSREETSNQNKKIADHIQLLKSKKRPLWFERVDVPSEMWWGGLPYEVQLAADATKTLSQILHCLESLHESGNCLQGNYSPDHLFYNSKLDVVEIVNDTIMSAITPMGLFLDYAVIEEVVRSHFTYVRFDIEQFPMYVEQFLTDIANIQTKPLLCSNSVSRSALSRPFCVWTSSERLNVFTAAIINAKAGDVNDPDSLISILSKAYTNWTPDFVNKKRVPAVWAARYNHKIGANTKKYFDNLFSQTDYARCLISHAKLPVKVMDAALYKKWGTLLRKVRNAVIDVLTIGKPAPEKTPDVPTESAQHVNSYDSIPTSNNFDLGEVIGLQK